MAWDDDKNIKIWMNGEFVKWEDANIHVLSHVVHYGSAVFEGLRCYENKNGSGIFRLKDHVDRLFNSAKIYNMPIPNTKEEISEAIKETVRINNLKSCYIRPISFRGYGELGVTPVNCPVNTTIAAWEWGSYLGEEGMTKGVKVGVSSWRKPAPDTLPTLAKAAANYMNSQLAKMEAAENGFDECIQLDYQGHVGEGSGENIFMIKIGEELACEKRYAHERDHALPVLQVQHARRESEVEEYAAQEEHEKDRVQRVQHLAGEHLVVLVRLAGHEVRDHDEDLNGQHAQVRPVQADRQPRLREIEAEQRGEHQHAGKHEAVVPHMRLLGPPRGERRQGMGYVMDMIYCITLRSDLQWSLQK